MFDVCDDGLTAGVGRLGAAFPVRRARVARLACNPVDLGQLPAHQPSAEHADFVLIMLGLLVPAVMLATAADVAFGSTLTP